MNRKIVLGGSVTLTGLVFAGWAVANIYNAEQVRLDNKELRIAAVQSDVPKTDDGYKVFEYDSLQSLEFSSEDQGGSVQPLPEEVENVEPSTERVWPPRKPPITPVPERKPKTKEEVLNSRPNCKAIQHDGLTALSCNVYHEARGESEAGQAMVALVTLNRVRSGMFGHTITDIVYQPRQFSWTFLKSVNGTPDDDTAWKTAVDIAWKARRGEVWVKGVTSRHLWYHEKNVSPSWRKDDDKKRTGMVDNHVIYAMVVEEE